MKQCACLFFRSATFWRASVVLIVTGACQPAAVSLPTVPPPSETAVRSPTTSPLPTITLTASPTPTVKELIFPYTIDGLRQHDFRSGDIHIRSMLDENDRFTTYLIDYPSDGLTITGVMQIPVGEGPFPVILMNHGFFSRSAYSSGDGTDRASAFLAEHGYITLASDYRTWADSDIGTSFFYSGLAIDVVNLIHAIPSVKAADPERVGMWGHSMGGGVTMKVLTVIGSEADPGDGEEHITPQVKAAVLYSTVSADQADVIERWGPGCFGDAIQGELIVGCNSSDVIPNDLSYDVQAAYLFAASDAETLREISPFYHLNLVDVPIQIHYGTEDGKYLSGTPPQWSVKLTQGLRDAGKYAELYQYEGEGHSFIGPPWFEFMTRTLRFFEAHVKKTSR